MQFGLQINVFWDMNSAVTQRVVVNREAEARKIHRFHVGGKNGERKKISSAILRRRTNRGSINIKK